MPGTYEVLALRLCETAKMVKTEKNTVLKVFGGGQTRIWGKGQGKDNA